MLALDLIQVLKQFRSEVVEGLKDFLTSTISVQLLQNFDFSEPIDVADRVTARKTVT